jgi:hypothetical protein
MYCNDCAKAHEWPESVTRSVGPCELCKTVDDCNEIPSRQLPTARANKGEIGNIVKSIADSKYECPHPAHEIWQYDMSLKDYTNPYDQDLIGTRQMEFDIEEEEQKKNKEKTMRNGK